MHQFSQHSLEQMQLRKIRKEDVENTISNPESVTTEDDLTVYQKLIYENNKTYLLRIFVNEMIQPKVIVTCYKTSKINKYLQP